MSKILATVGSALSSVNSIEELRSNFHKVMAEFDLEQYTYQIVQHEYLHNMKNFFVTTYPKEWEKHYIKENYFESDPLVNRFLTSPTPFLWGTESISKDNSKARKMILESSDFNLQDGIGIPIPGPNNSFAIFTLCSKGSKGKYIGDLYDHYYHELWICCLLFHSAFMSLNLHNQLHRREDLTNRELDCLKWMCAGKNAEDISSILNISSHTVRYRIRGIFKKLNVHNRTDAVVTALRYKLIEL